MNEDGILLCIPHKESLCESCIDIHIAKYESSDHKIVPIKILKEIEENYNLEQQLEKQKIRNILIKMLNEEKIDIKTKAVEVLGILSQRKDKLKKTIDDIFDKKKQEIEQSIQNAINVIDSHLYQIANNSSSFLASINTEEQVSKIVFTDKKVPLSNIELEELIDEELDIGIKFYSEGRPECLYYFQPGTSRVFKIEILTGKQTSYEIDFTCKDHPGICIGPDNTLFYSGGWEDRGTKNCYIFDCCTYDTQEIQPMIKRRFQHSAIYLKPYFYVFGGMKTIKSTMSKNKPKVALDKPTKSAERWNGKNWERLRCKLSENFVKGSICECNNKIYLGGKSFVEVFDPQSSSFTHLDLKWEKKLSCVLVSFNNSVVIFRGKTIGQLDENNIYYKTGSIMETEWCTSSPCLVSGAKIFFLLDMKGCVYSYNYYLRKLEAVCSLKLSFN
ncbi:hypothetical protein SteCoe_12396 [Stentor coeruleus]|uniref:Uncharacterized protein n=1 Tax=Stentor coeruleus TaxID=5963 RepID=A0A1R2CAU1_9CILI|nr:hypothetical protein SteCoe_12396 [Stentor coeruleus]